MDMFNCNCLFCFISLINSYDCNDAESPSEGEEEEACNYSEEDGEYRIYISKIIHKLIVKTLKNLI